MAGKIKIIEPRENFQKVSKDIIFNNEIDVLTLGIYVKVLCLGKKWEMSVDGLAKTLNLSVAKIKAAFSLLERSGYLKRIHIKDEQTGRFLGFDYHIGSEPFPQEERTDLVATHSTKSPSNPPEIQPMENPTDGKPNRREIQPMENGGDINRDIKVNRDKKENIDLNLNPPSPLEVVAYCREIGFRDPAGFTLYYLEEQKRQQWKKKNGEPIVNWKNNVRVWWRYHKDEIFPRPASMAPRANENTLISYLKNEKAGTTNAGI